MLETSAQPPEPRPALSITNRFAAVCKHAVRWIPPKARLAVLCGSLVLAVLAVYTSLSSGPATLNLVCRHNLQSADLSVSVDGKVIYSDQISDGAKKRFGIFGKRVGKTFSKSLVVASGEHAVQVHLTS